jgi:hypothetical protein
MAFQFLMICFRTFGDTCCYPKSLDKHGFTSEAGAAKYMYGCLGKSIPQAL